MPQQKKRLSKTAKAALKILNESKLLTSAKSANDLKNEQDFNEPEVSAKTAAPHKMRPNKKRG